MPTLTILPVDQGRVERNPVIPNHHRLLLPLNSSLEISAKSDVIIQKLQQRIRLFLFIAYDVAGELRVDEKSFLARNGVRANQWVLSDDWLSAYHSITRSRRLNLLNTRVSSLETVETALEFWGKASISLDLIDEQSISTSSWLIQDIKESSSWWLKLVCHIRVPCHGGSTTLEVFRCEFISCATVDEMYFWISLWRSGGGMDVVAAEVLAVLEGVGDGEVGKVLVAEGDHFALGDEAGEFVFAGVGQGGELNTLNGRANGWSQVDAVDALSEEVIEGEVSVLAVVVVLEWSQRTVLLLRVEGWKVVGVLSDMLEKNVLKMLD